MFLQIRDFVLHLRLNYQIFILSGPYLLGVLLSNYFSSLQLLQYFSVHVLLFGGVTAYNSYFDKDEGPIGGLKNPPKMSPWMLEGAWMLQFIGLLFAFYSGLYFVGLYLISAVLFWMYSSPHIRLKGKPILSLVGISISTALLACLLGYYANGTTESPSLSVALAALGSSLLVVSLYPLSQAYQVDEDKKRGDATFSVKYGKKGVRNIFLFLFPLGLAFVIYGLLSVKFSFAILSLIGGAISFGSIFLQMKKLTMTVSDYELVMTVKYAGGLLFSFFILLFIALRL